MPQINTIVKIVNSVKVGATIMRTGSVNPAGGGGKWGRITGIITNQTDLIQLFTDIIDGAPNTGDTLGKLYDLIVSGFSEITVADIAARDAYDVLQLPTNIFVLDDGDTNWALYKAITTGVGATFVKLSDPDLLNAVMSASSIKSAYESNTDTNAFTDALLLKLNAIEAAATANDTDANLKNRANHTGAQAISTVTGLQTALDTKMESIDITVSGLQAIIGTSACNSKGVYRITNANQGPLSGQAAPNNGSPGGTVNLLMYSEPWAKFGMYDLWNDIFYPFTRIFNLPSITGSSSLDLTKNFLVNDIIKIAGTSDEYVCSDNTSGSAVWTLLTNANGSEVTVADIAARDAYDVLQLPTNIFVLDDGDGNWALYKATTTGVGATFVKLSDPDLLNAIMSASSIKSSYESNADTNAYTDAEKLKLSNQSGINTGDQNLTALAPKASPTFTGTVTLPSSSPSAALEAASKGYVDVQISSPNITIITAVSITTNTLDAGSLNQHNRNVVISNGVNAINLTCDTSSNAAFCASYMKLGSGVITFVAGAGATLVQVDGTALLNGAVGSTACLTRTGNTFYLQISNR
jgi:hypothetical protein